MENQKKINQNPRFVCIHGCGKSFTQANNRSRHHIQKHFQKHAQLRYKKADSYGFIRLKLKFTCKLCGLVLNNRRQQLKHKHDCLKKHGFFGRKRHYKISIPPIGHLEGSDDCDEYRAMHYDFFQDPKNRADWRKQARAQQQESKAIRRKEEVKFESSQPQQ